MAQKIYKPATPVKSSSAVNAKSAGTANTAKPTVKPTQTAVHFVFDKSNYRFLIISFAIVVFGFILMSGTTDIYNDTKIVIAPLVVLAGFGLGFYAILKKPSAL